jgi:signal transduction histidine kinase
MQSHELLIKIKDEWANRLAARFAHADGMRKQFQEELLRFFELLDTGLVEDNPRKLDPILIDWSDALTQSDLEDRSATISSICSEIFSLTYIICREQLAESDALDLITSLIPYQTYALIQSSQLEKEREVQHVQSEMEQVRNELERLDKSKSDFISVAAHELKTPLTLIEGYAAMLRESVSKIVGINHVQTLLDGMDLGAERLKQIIDDMIDVSLIDNHLLTLNFQPMWVNRMIDILKEEYEDAILLRRQTLSVELFDGSGEMLFADTERIYQAFSNLLSNAIKFTPDKGKIKISGRSLPGFIEIIFSDTGIGIAPEDQTRIFEKFNRTGDVALHSSGKIKFKGGGPGLGLPITKGIIEAHGGALWVESDGYDEVKYPGSRFHVLLPARKEPPDEQIAKLFRPLSER